VGHLVENPAQGTGEFTIRSGCWMPCPLKFWISPRMGIPWALWEVGA